MRGGGHKRGDEPASMEDVLANLVVKLGLGRQRREDELGDTWRELVGPGLAEHTAAVGVRRGKLEILVSDAIFAQELAFRKEELLAAFRERMKDTTCEDWNIRVGTVNMGEDS